MIDIKERGVESTEKQQRLYAKINDGQWYAIPPGMADSFREAGAEVRQCKEPPQ